MKKFLLMLLVILVIPTITYSQRYYIPFNLYTHNYKLLNPSYAGVENKEEFTFNYKYHAIDLGGAPKSILISYNRSFEKLKSTIGAIIFNDKVGVGNYNFYGLLYNYKFSWGENSFRAGTQLRYEKETLNYSLTDPYNIGDPFYKNDFTDNYFDMDVGFTYKVNKLTISSSVNNLIRRKPSLLNIDKPMIESLIQRKFEILKYLTASPSVRYSTDFTYYFIDINNSFTFLNLIQLGVTYKIYPDYDNSFNLNAGIEIIDTFHLKFILYNNSYRSMFVKNDNKIFEMMMKVIISK